MLLLLAFSLIAVHVAMPSPGVQVTVAARELPTGSLTQNESLCEEVIDRLNAMSDLRHASVIQMFGVVSPTTTPTLVSLTTSLNPTQSIHISTYMHSAHLQLKPSTIMLLLVCDGSKPVHSKFISFTQSLMVW